MDREQVKQALPAMPSPGIDLLAPLAVLFVLLIDSGTRLWTAAGGKLVFPLEDAYIHLSIADNLAARGIWGVSGDAVATASSSPGWVLLLAPWAWASLDWVAVALNAIAAIVAVILGRTLLVDLQVPVLPRTLGLSVAAIAATSGELVFTGMEHTAFLAAATAVLVATTKRSRLALALACLVAGSLRIESVFLVAGLVVGLVGVQRRGDALACLTVGIAPLLHGVCSWSSGWFWLPSGMVMKRQHLGVSLLESLPSGLVNGSMSWPWMVVGTAVALLVAFRHSNNVRLPLALAVAFGGLGQLLVSELGRFYRFDSPWVFLALLLALGASDWKKRRSKAATAAGVVAAALLTMRVARVRQVFDTQVGLIERNAWAAASFFAELDDGPVVAWDLGVLSWRDVHVVDAAGLGTREIATLRSDGAFDSNALRDLAAESGARAAVFFPVHLERTGASVPAEWIFVGAWVDPELGVEGPKLSFYATHQDAVVSLEQALRDDGQAARLVGPAAATE